MTEEWASQTRYSRIPAFSLQDACMLGVPFRRILLSAETPWVEVPDAD